MVITSRVGKILFRIFQLIYSKIIAVIYGGPPQGVPPIKSSILMESATSLANKIRTQKVTSVEVVRAYINRIQEINETLNCVVEEHFEDALKEAAKADDVISSGMKTMEEIESETPFLGVPFTTEQTRMGFPFARMQEAGGVHIASTNVSESRYGRETNNRKFGRTLNPYDTNRAVGGPSGGEACVVASCGSPFGIATFGCISSAFNGVFCHSYRDVCCISRSSADLLPAMKLLTQNTDIAKPDLKSIKFYYTDYDDDLTTPVEEDIKQAIQNAVDHFKNNHKATVQKVHVTKLREAYAIWRSKTCEGNKQGKSSRKELVKAIFGKSQNTLTTILTEMLENMVGSNATLENLSELLKEFQELLGTDGVFIYPTQPAAAFRHNESLVKVFDVSYAGVFRALGMPATHCPIGLDSRDLPVGFQIVAAPGQDHLTIAVACEMDKAFGGWKPPPSRGTFTLKNTVFHSISNEKVKVL